MAQQINYHKIEARSLVDGPGERTVLFMQGCSIHCPGCQNIHLWEHKRGFTDDTDTMAFTLAYLAGEGGNITISGGEPFEQPMALAALLRALKDKHGIGHVIVYSGYTWEKLTSGDLPADVAVSVLAALSRIDVLVDGPFIKALDDTRITYRGSRNQRPIDVQASMQAGYPVVLDWDEPEIVIAGDGSVVLPIGLAAEFAEIGQVVPTRMCGQTKKSLQKAGA